MLASLKLAIWKRIYKLLIFKTIVLNKDTKYNYNRLKKFCTLGVETTKGTFTFVFKEDRRKLRREKYMLPNIGSFLIELIVPETLSSEDCVLKDKIVIVIKIMLFKVDYEILTRVLTDMYLDAVIKHIREIKEQNTLIMED